MLSSSAPPPASLPSFPPSFPPPSLDESLSLDPLVLAADLEGSEEALQPALRLRLSPREISLERSGLPIIFCHKYFVINFLTTCR